MTTSQTLIVSLAAVVIVAVIALAQWRVRLAELASDDAKAARSSEERLAGREREAALETARAARVAMGPDDGAKLGVHIAGGQLIQGTRVKRGDSAAEGWIVLDDAELLEGVRSTPLGGKQWIRDTGWLQEL